LIAKSLLKHKILSERLVTSPDPAPGRSKRFS
jgi:hypothetical protein